MSNPTSPCDWPLAYPDPEDETCAPCSALDSLSPERREHAEQMAIELLWNWTGRRFGTCEVEVRPCRASCPDRSSTFWGTGSNSSALIPQVGGWIPALISGEWFNIGCGTCPTSRCSCALDAATSLELPGPVHEISEIWIGGELLPETAYQLRNGVLFRVDGGSWPVCNSDAADPQEPDSPAWSITYAQGYPVPIGGQVAAYTLACELAKNMCGDNDCQLPARLQSVTRQGVSVEIFDGFEDLEEGRTGIWEIDSWITSVTLKRISPPQVFSPDIAPGHMSGTFAGLGFGRTR